jgi:hypothetical protein
LVILASRMRAWTSSLSPADTRQLNLWHHPAKLHFHCPSKHFRFSLVPLIMYSHFPPVNPIWPSPKAIVHGGGGVKTSATFGWNWGFGTNQMQVQVCYIVICFN